MKTEIDAPRSVSFAEALRFWLKLGFISFGGPAGQIAIMHQELVQRKRWISERRFLHALNYCMLLPGPEAQQLATYIGWLLHRTWGGIAAGGLFVLPSLLVLIALSWVYMAFGGVEIVAGILYGLKPAVAVIVIHAAYRIGKRALRNALLWLIAAAAFVAIFAFNVPFPYIVLAAAIVGYIGGRISPESFVVNVERTAQAEGDHRAVIDDSTPTPPHAQFRWWRIVVVSIVGVALWATAIAILAGVYGVEHTFTQIAWFFTKAALLTFGGAYAVLPYVYQGGVEHYQWLTAAQMMDGLALGETTPGPLIMVVAFIGFVAAWGKALLGPENLFLAGVLGAVIATYFTFLPSFIFIFLGGPIVETTHGNIKITAPLAGITAAVVGVIVNLGVLFAWYVFWPNATRAAPFSGIFEWPALVIAAIAAAALVRFKLSVMLTIAICALSGMAFALIASK